MTIDARLTTAAAAVRQAGDVLHAARAVRHRAIAALVRIRAARGYSSTMRPL